MLKTNAIISIITVSLLFASLDCTHDHACGQIKHSGMCSTDPEEKASTTDYLDKQINEYKTDFPGATVSRAANEIRIILPSDSIFQKESSEFLSSGESNLKKIASTLKQYDSTNVVIAVYTDSIGPANKNLILTQEQALKTANLFESNGVNKDRITSYGYGSKKPLPGAAANETMKVTRRIEIVIYANEALKKAAVKGK